MSGTIAERLRGKDRVCIDSMTMIYFIERHPTYLGVVRPLFELVGRGELRGLSSYIALLEVLVKPLKDGREDLVKEYRDILVGSRSFTLHPVDRATAEKGAEISAQYNLGAPDAIQLATATLQGAQAFVTNDMDLRRFPGVEILLLDEFIPGAPVDGSA